MGHVCGEHRWPMAPRWRTPPDGAVASPRPDVGAVEVVLPGRAVVADLPATGDGRAVLAEGAGVALAEVERREVRLLPPQRPDAVPEAHLVDARDAARVEVVLEVVALPFGIGA